MDLNELKERAYRTAVEHGWHEEPWSDEHLLMLVITEAAEAVQADRKGKRANVQMFKEWQGNHLAVLEETRTARFIEDFEAYIKNTLEDELADVVVRLLDLAGLCGWDLSTAEQLMEHDMRVVADSFPEFMFGICCSLMGRYEVPVGKVEYVIAALFCWCRQEGIDLAWFIEEKMRYNELREYKYGGRKY